MGHGRKGMKGAQNARRGWREAWGIIHHGGLLPQTYPTRWAVDHAAGPGDKVVKLEIRVIHE